MKVNIVSLYFSRWKILKAFPPLISLIIPMLAWFSFFFSFETSNDLKAVKKGSSDEVQHTKKFSPWTYNSPLIERRRKNIYEMKERKKMNNENSTKKSIANILHSRNLTLKNKSWKTEQIKNSKYLFISVNFFLSRLHCMISFSFFLIFFFGFFFLGIAV